MWSFFLFQGAWTLVPEAEAQTCWESAWRASKVTGSPPEINEKAKCLLQRWNPLGDGQGAGPAGLSQDLGSAQKRPGQSPSLCEPMQRKRRPEGGQEASSEELSVRHPHCASSIPRASLHSGNSKPLFKEETGSKNLPKVPRHRVQNPSNPSAMTGVHWHASASLPLLFLLVWGAFQKYTFLRRPTESENVGGPDIHLKFFPE